MVARPHTRKRYKRAIISVIALFAITFIYSLLLILSKYRNILPSDQSYYIAYASNWVLRACIPVAITYGINRKVSISLLIYLIGNLIDEAYYHSWLFEWNDAFFLLLAIASFLLPTIGKKAKFDVFSIGFILSILVLLFSRNDFYGLSNAEYDYVYNKGDAVAILITSISIALLSRRGVLTYAGMLYMCFSLFNLLNEIGGQPQKLMSHEVILLTYFSILSVIAVVWKYKKDNGQPIRGVNKVNMTFHLLIAGLLLSWFAFELFIAS